MEIGITFTKEELTAIVDKAVRDKIEVNANRCVLEHMRTYEFADGAKSWFMEAVDEYMPNFLEDNKEEIIRLVAKNLISAMRYSNKDVLTALLAVGEGRDK